MRRGKHRAPPWEPKSRGRARSLVLLATTAIAVMLLSVAFAGAEEHVQSGNGVEPIVVAGNPSCATLNADGVNFPTITSSFGFKINGSPNGVFTLTNPPGELTGGAPSDPDNAVTISNSNGTTFDWSATPGDRCRHRKRRTERECLCVLTRGLG